MVPGSRSRSVNRFSVRELPCTIEEVTLCPEPKSRRVPVSLGIVLSEVLLLVACHDGTEHRRAEAVVRDSAGIRIVENIDPVWRDEEGWTVAPEPSLTIGEVDGPDAYLLYRVRGARRLEDGRVVVANGGTNELRIFDASGRHQVTMGGQGEGPGEFSYLDKLLPWSGDSVAASDRRQRRISVFSTSGVLGRTIRFPNTGGWPIPGGLAADGSIALEPNTGPVGQQQDHIIEANQQPLLRFDPVGERYDTIAFTLSVRWVGGWRVQNAQGRSVRVAVPIPFSGAPHLAAGPSGVYFGYSSTYQIHRWTPERRLDMIVHRAVEPRPVTDEDRAQAWDTATGIRNLRGGVVRQRRADVVFNETLPVFDALLVDDLGYLWVRDFAPPWEPPPPWAVYDTTGIWLGTVQTPQGVNVWQVGSDFVIGTKRDESNVESVGVWQLERGG